MAGNGEIEPIARKMKERSLLAKVTGRTRVTAVMSLTDRFTFQSRLLIVIAGVGDI